MLQTDLTAGVLRLTLNRPEVRNALDETLIAALRDAFESVPEAATAVVLRGAGKGFCAGGDLDYMRRMGGFSREENLADAERLAATFRAIERCRAPVIVAIHGACMGGGCGLAAAADVVIADPSATFAFSEVRLGLIPATISPFVVRRIGLGAARRLFVTGELFDAAEAHRIGLVDRIADPDGLDEAIAHTLAILAKNAPRAMVEARNLALDGPLPLDECARRLAEARAGDEAKEGLTAFLEKRPANYRP